MNGKVRIHCEVFRHFDAKRLALAKERDKLKDDPFSIIHGY
jgi:hypothetical protein